MTIRTSSARDVEALLQQLRSPVALERDAAIARLRIIGSRARDRVLALLADAGAGRDVRVAALKVVDALDDPASKRATLAATADPDPVIAIAAIQVLRSWLVVDDDTAALERVSAIVADATGVEEVRRAALDALSELPASLTEPLVQSVAAQLSPAPPLDTAAGAREWLANHEQAPLGALHDLLTQARNREREAPDDRLRQEWCAVRTAVHAVLARRGSRIALYDLREMFEQAQAALPLDVLVAMRTIGDLTCLDALAHAWETMSADAWWREQTQDAATAIIAREQATSRNAAVKRVRTKWPGFLA